MVKANISAIALAAALAALPVATSAQFAPGPGPAPATGGTAATATALALTPTLCATGQAPTGILANGDATGCAASGGSPYFAVNSTGAAAMATGNNAVAIGPSSNASGNYSVAIGEGSDAGRAAVAIGLTASASGTYAVAVGEQSNASGNYSMALGLGASSVGSYSIALGNQTSASGGYSVALGYRASAVNGYDVALGYNSATAASVATSNAVIGGTTYGGFAGTAPSSTVSVGTVGGERTITNVAAARVTSTSTDAVNGSELYAVADALNGPLTLSNANNTAVPPVTINNSTNTTDLYIRHSGANGSTAFNRIDTPSATPPTQPIYQLTFGGRSASGPTLDYGAIVIDAPSDISGSEAGQMQFSVFTPGQTLQSAMIGSGATGFNVGDTVVLAGTGGVTSPYSNPMTIIVTGETGGVPTSYATSSNALYTTLPTGFTEVSTSGSGVNFTLTSPVWNGGNLAYRAVTISPGLFTLSPGFALHMGPGVTPVIAADGDVIRQGYTVATLPAGTEGEEGYVTDATAWTPGATVTGGGSTRVPVIFLGGAWKVQ